MLLGAAKYLAETRNFSGRAALIFQPAEGGGGGGQVMCQEGIMDRFNISQVFGIHNAPDAHLGTFHTNKGALMAAADTFYIHINGSGGRGAQPEDHPRPFDCRRSTCASLSDNSITQPWRPESCGYFRRRIRVWNCQQHHTRLRLYLHPARRGA